jgi:ubiquinone/menaquinone biosynthesis C-methylase UbiE
MSFAVAGAAYDRFMGRYSVRLAPVFASFAGVQPGQRVLDVGCGPGALTAELVQRLGTGSVAAADPSPPFVTAIRERLPGVRVEQAPAEQMPFEDGEFDTSLAQLVIAFMQDPLAGVREMARCTRPGGVVAACMWSRHDMQLLTSFWNVAERLVDSSVSASENRLSFRTREHIEQVLGEAGLEDLQAELLTVEAGYRDFAELADTYAERVGPAGAFFAQLDGDQQAALVEGVRAELGDPHGPFTHDGNPWAVRGRVPG